MDYLIFDTLIGNNENYALLIKTKQNNKFLSQAGYPFLTWGALSKKNTAKQNMPSAVCALSIYKSLAHTPIYM